MRRFGQLLTGFVCCGICTLVGCASQSVVVTGTPPAPSSTTPITTTAKAKFVYVGNQGSSVSGYSANTSTGALTALAGFPVNLYPNPQAVAVDPQNRFLFVADASSIDEVHVFTINSGTGTLNEISTSPYTTVSEPVAIAVDPSGTHVYVVGQNDNSVGGFSLGSTGVLTPISGSPFPTSGTLKSVNSVVINSAGTFVYVKDTVNVYTYSVDTSSGALTLVQTTAGQSLGGGIALDPHGTYLYTVGSGANSIQTYSINATTGQLALKGSSPMAEHNGAYTISISPTGQFAYTIENNNYLVSYALSNGVFTSIGSIYSHIYGIGIGIDPSGSFVYVPQSCSSCPSGVYNVIHEFSIGSTGALTKLSGSPVAAGTTPWGIAFTTQ
jgi:6-phosphogluconolactonase (cycloisomerase 2 family)